MAAFKPNAWSVAKPTVILILISIFATSSFAAGNEAKKVEATEAAIDASKPLQTLKLSLDKLDGVGRVAGAKPNTRSKMKLARVAGRNDSEEQGSGPKLPSIPVLPKLSNLANLQGAPTLQNLKNLQNLNNLKVPLGSIVQTVPIVPDVPIIPGMI